MASLRVTTKTRILSFTALSVQRMGRSPSLMLPEQCKRRMALASIAWVPSRDGTSMGTEKIMDTSDPPTAPSQPSMSLEPLTHIRRAAIAPVQSLDPIRTAKDKIMASCALPMARLRLSMLQERLEALGLLLSMGKV